MNTKFICPYGYKGRQELEHDAPMHWTKVVFIYAIYRRVGSKYFIFDVYARIDLFFFDKRIWFVFNAFYHGNDDIQVENRHAANECTKYCRKLYHLHTLFTF